VADPVAGGGARQEDAVMADFLRRDVPRLGKREENLREVARGPLDQGRLAQVREFGRAVHG
jgi:hypothetical protein